MNRRDCRNSNVRKVQIVEDARRQPYGAQTYWKNDWRQSMRGLLLGLVVALSALPALAQTREDDRANCLSSDPDIAILACTADINSGEESPEVLAGAYFDRGTLYAHTRHYDQAIADYTKSIALRPQSQAYNNRGNVYADKGLNDEAIADFTKSIALKPNSMAYHNRGVIYM